MAEPIIIPAPKLVDFGAEILSKVGVPEGDARKVAEILVESNLRGVDTHGIYLVNLYSKRIEKGLVNPSPSMKFEKTRAATGVLDADTALGQLATLRAMEHAMEMARACGSGTVLVKRSTHFGAGAYYTNYAAEHDMIGILMSQSETDVVLFGGKKPYLGTNPYSVAIPAGKHKPFLMDMATSEVAFGKVRAAAEAGQTIPPNWAVDENGNPVTDATLAKAVTPMSGAKGYAIGLMIELFSSALSGMAFGPGIVRKFDDWERPQQLGYFVQAIDPTAWCDLATFKARADKVMDEIAAQPPAEGNPFGRVLIPGEPEYERREKRLMEGCPVAPVIAAQLAELGWRHGVPWPG
ncbi:MAG: Ldh family oxidoreductase [Candidatus Omnitrophica bacterium]|nr:putative oxidoreductase YjmC [bacterium]NUN96606.1 Ldh family oxidoreductase [Candidatus Omnitrophota bacterium]